MRTKIKYIFLECGHVIKCTPESIKRKKKCRICTGNYYDHDMYERWLNEHREGEIEVREKYINDYTKIKHFFIKCGHENIIAPTKIKQGRGCAKCSRSYSKPAAEWLDKIEKENNVILEREYKFNPENKAYKADGYDKKTNTIYEFYGDVWHGNPDHPRFIISEEDHKKKHKNNYGKRRVNKKIRI